MSVIVTDTGFGSDDWDGATLVLPSDTDPETLPQGLHTDTLVVLEVPNFADGRALTLARLLRLSGFEGRIRARGHVISDQYAMARRAGIDEVEIDDDLAARQPEAQWRFRADWQAHNYQARLRAAGPVTPGPAVVAG